MLLPRFFDNLNQFFSPSKVLVIYGPRQVGKTTLLKNFLKKIDLRYKLVSGDDLSVQEVFSSQTLSKISEFCSGYQLLAIDEAQKIKNIGHSLKLIVDNLSPLQIIVTGSSSFDLSGQIGEPLTGRKITLILYPISQIELKMVYNPYELKKTR